MERIDFYLLASAEPRQIQLFACRLAEKAHSQSHHIFIRTRDREQALALDELLWTFRQGSFIPHALTETGAEESVLIGERLPETARRDLLINLGPGLPPEWERFHRLAEVLEPTPAVLEEGRQRFKHYRERGITPHYHKLETAS